MNKWTIKVIFENGNYFHALINGTKEEIKNYYVGKIFNMGLAERDIHKCVRVEFI